MHTLDLRRFVLGLGIVTLLIAPASAKNLLTARHGAAQVFTATGYLKIAAGSVGGPYIQNFTVDKTEIVMISFSAVCSTSGTTTQYTTIRIRLDGNYLYPTNQQDDAFCSTAGATSASHGLDTHTVITAVTVGTGIHGIQIQVTPWNGGTSRIDNLSLLVWN